MSNITFDTDSVIGVDFGTSFSSASRLNPETNTPEIITFIDNGLAQIPSIVFINDKGGIDVGHLPMLQLERLSHYDPMTKQKILSHTLREENSSDIRMLISLQLFFLKSNSSARHQVALANPLTA